MIVKSDEYPEGIIQQTIPDKYVWRDREGNWWIYYAGKIYNVHILGRMGYGINYKLEKGDRAIYPDVFKYFAKVTKREGGKNGL